MLELFHKYLIIHKKAIIPGLGIFSIERQPARLDFANKIFVAPSSQIVFKNEPAVADTNFYSFVSHEQNIEEETAIKNVDEFTLSLKHYISANTSVQLPGVGLLTKNEVGELEFAPLNTLQNYFPNVTAEKVIRPDAQHDILVGDTSRTNTEMQEMLTSSKKVKDYWWVFAIILAFIGIAALVYYYLQNGSFE